MKARVTMVRAEVRSKIVEVEVARFSLVAKAAMKPTAKVLADVPVLELQPWRIQHVEVQNVIEVLSRQDDPIEPPKTETYEYVGDTQV